MSDKLLLIVNKGLEQLYLLKDQKIQQMPKEVKQVRWLFPTFDNSFVTISPSGRLQHVNSQSQSLFATVFNSPIKRAEMLSSKVVLVLCPASLFLIDLPKRQVTEVVQQKTSNQEQVLILKDFFAFRDMLFCVIIENLKEENSTVAYFSGKKILTKENIKPVFQWKEKEFKFICRGNARSMVCWVNNTSFSKRKLYFQSLELSKGQDGKLHGHTEQQCCQIAQYLNIENKFFKIVELTPTLFAITYDTLLEIPQEDKSLKYVETLFEKQSKQVSHRFSQVPFSHACTLEDMKPPGCLILNQKGSRSIRALYVKTLEEQVAIPLNLQKNVKVGLLEYEYFGFYEWSFSNQSSSISVANWQLVSLKDIYVFFLQGWDLDEDLIWDVIKLLFKNE